jgi:hypothetical protein
MTAVLLQRAPARRDQHEDHRHRPRVWTSSQWLEHFRRSAANRRPMPWEKGAGISAAELALVTRSLQSWQLGESSDGSHLRAAAARHAEQTGDLVFPEVAELFVREEQGHGELIGRFLDLAGPGRVQRDWGDRLFRGLRHWRCDLEAWTTPVLVAEILALVYYDAVRHATASPLLRAVCDQLLADEVSHIRFQSERFATFYRGRSPRRRRLALAGQRALFLAGVLTVWVGHRHVLTTGGYGWRRYWRTCWGHARRAWARMDPDLYEWAD